MIPLKNVLLVNAVSSGLTGFALIIAGNPITQIFGMASAVPIISVGVFLVAFALFVFSVSRKTPITKSEVRLIAISDSVWVLASIDIIIFQMFGLSTVGYVIIGAVAAWVALMAILQFKGLKQISLS